MTVIPMSTYIPGEHLTPINTTCDCAPFPPQVPYALPFVNLGFILLQMVCLLTFSNTFGTLKQQVSYLWIKDQDEIAFAHS